MSILSAYVSVTTGAASGPSTVASAPEHGAGGGPYIVFGGESEIYVSAAAHSFVGTPEATEPSELLTDLFYAMGEEGECVYRRLYITMFYEAGISLTITPVVDGVELVGDKVTITRAGGGRETVEVPFSKRGSGVQARIVIDPATGNYAIESKVGVMFSPGTAAKVNG